MSNEKTSFPVESLPLDPVKNKFQGETPLLPLMARLETPLPPDRIRSVPVPTPFDIPPPLLYNSKVI